MGWTRTGRTKAKAFGMSVRVRKLRSEVKEIAAMERHLALRPLFQKRGEERKGDRGPSISAGDQAWLFEN